MKLSVSSVGKLFLINLCLTHFSNHGVSAVKLEILSLLPNTIRKAKQGFGKYLLHRSSTPPLIVIPQCTGIASLDQALFHTLNVGKTMKVSLAAQCNAMLISKFVLPNMMMVLMSTIPVNQLERFVSAMPRTTAEQKAVAKEGIQHLQTIVRVMLSSRILQMLSITLKDTIMSHAAIVHPTLNKVIESAPKVIPQIAIVMLAVHGIIKFNTAVVLPFYRIGSSVKVTPITTNENKVTATFMPIIKFVEDDSVVTDIAEDAEFTTVPVPIESMNNNDKTFEVNVTKISAVLDRFESKILSLVGGTRFHPTPLESEHEEIEEVTHTLAALDDAHVTSTMCHDFEITEVSDDDEQVNDAQDDENFSSQEETNEIDIEQARADSESCSVSDKSNHAMESLPSFKSYELTFQSSPSVWATIMTPSSNTAVRAIGIITCALFSVNVLPSFARNTIAVFAGLFLLGMIVQEIRGGLTKCSNVDALNSLIHDIEARSLSYTNKMEPLVVESKQDEIETTLVTRSSLRFWRTRLPILDGIVNLVTSRDCPTDKDISDPDEQQEVRDDSSSNSPQFESVIHYYKEVEQETTQQETATQTKKNVWQWMTTASSKPKMTRTACTAIVGM